MKTNMLRFFVKHFSALLIFLFLFTLVLIYISPVVHGLILLPLDLLVTTYAPWYMPGTILLKNPYMQDSIVQLFPWHHFTFEALANGFIPLWNPYQFLGMPFMANLKSMVFYPLNIFFIFGEVKAWNILLFLQLFLGLIFSYALAVNLGLKKAPSILLALAFSFNSYMIGLLEFGSDAQTIIWWPLMILFVKKYIDKRDAKYLALFPIVFAFSIFAGQLQYIGYFLIVLFLFTVYYGRQVKMPIISYVWLLFSLLLGLGVSGVQLLPALELFRYSHRGLLDASQNHEVFSRGLMPVKDLLRLLSPDFFGNPVTRDSTISYIETSGYFGIIPLFFAILAILFERKNVIVKFFGWVFGVSLLLSLQGFGEILYLLRIPLITSGSAERIFVIVLFSGAILSGFGFSHFLKERNYKKLLIPLFAFFVVMSFSIAAYFFLNRSLTTFLHNVSFQFAIFVAFVFLVIAWRLCLHFLKKGTVITIVFAFLVVGLTFFDLYRFGYRFLTFSNIKFLYPQTPVAAYIQKESSITLNREYGLAEPELSTYLHAYAADTYNPLYLSRTAQLLQALQGKPSSKLSIDNKYFITADGDNLKRTLDFLGVKYIVIGKYEDPASKYFHNYSFGSMLQKIYEDDKYKVFVNSSASPRFGLFYKTKVIPDNAKMLTALSMWGKKNENTLLLSQTLPVALQSGTGSATFVRSNPNQEVFNISTTTEALFYISDTYFPGWKASVNGKDTKIYQANYNFRAVLVPKGNSLLTFSYLPSSFLFGIAVSGMSCLIVLGIFLQMFLSKRNK